jgi:hypothetical protein
MLVISLMKGIISDGPENHSNSFHSREWYSTKLKKVSKQTIVVGMFALIVLMLATPILTDRHAAMAQKDIRNAGPPGGKGGVTKAGAENQKLSKPNAASAPNLLQSPIEKGTSASTSPNAPKANHNCITVATDSKRGNTRPGKRC